MNVLADRELRRFITKTEDQSEYTENISTGDSVFIEWEYPLSTFTGRVYLHQEADGGFSVHCPSLPGVVSQGETRTEALEMIQRALRAAIQVYVAEGQTIPWSADPVAREADEEELWITVHV